jgi:hypothetical protein
MMTDAPTGGEPNHDGRRIQAIAAHHGLQTQSRSLANERGDQKHRDSLDAARMPQPSGTTVLLFVLLQMIATSG